MRVLSHCFTSISGIQVLASFKIHFKRRNMNNETNAMGSTSTNNRNDSMGRSDSERRLERDETSNLISSEKVEGTAVYNRQGEKLGTVRNFMVRKRNGRVEYAVMSFGGVLGMGESCHPLPWDVLDCDTDKGGYVVDIDKEQLKSGPSYKRDLEPTYDRQYGENVYGHYGRTY